MNLTSPSPSDAPSSAGQGAKAFAELQLMVASLFAPSGDVWSGERTLSDFGRYLVEEAGEVSGVIAAMGELPVPSRVLPETISPPLIGHFKEEIGDVFWNVAVLACMAEQAGWFSLSEVLEGLIVKMKERNAPFFRGGPQFTTSEAVNKHWAAVKAQERLGNYDH